MMNKRNLRSNTIVPAELYVERAADRQLSAIIDDMGRPGYVLVARQMGKTNLLLNMKRQRRGDIVLYLDLSRRFDSATSWFRNVIDSLLESYGGDFEGAAEIINRSRENQVLDASVEYDRHIRQILRDTAKTVVIILDEIDSLVNTPYSDIILSQIRSMYFSRASYPEYNRLTYVLSGVAEPTDLIKDKNISPFNIGEKIYLDNFDRAELGSFVSKAELGTDASVVDALFSWTSGNPRMTWDLCAELERLRNDGADLKPGLVDDVVERLYLQEFDRPPVDHIRTLVQSDAQIRSAIDEIRYGKSEFIDAKIKSRIYLAGITTSAGKSLRISNRIIDQALSDQWINQVNGSQPDASEVAAASYSNGNYSASIEQFEKIMMSLKSEADFPPVNRKLLGLSYLHSGSGAKAIHQLSLCLSAGGSAEHVQELQFFLAVAHTTQNNWKEALGYFEKAQSGPDTNFALNAKLETVHVLIELGTQVLWERALSISKELIGDLQRRHRVAPNDPVVRARLTSALYYRARVYASLKKLVLATNDVDAALLVASSNVPPALLLLEYDLASDERKRAEIAATICEIVISRRIKIDAVGDLSKYLTRKEIAQILFLLQQHGLNGEFDRLLDYYSVEQYQRTKPLFSILVELCAQTGDEEEITPHFPLLIDAIKRHLEGAPPLDVLAAYRIVALNCPEHLKLEYIQHYLLRLEELSYIEEPFFDFSDFTACLYIFGFFKRNKLSRQYKRLLDVWLRYKPKAKSLPKSWSIYILHFEMDLYRETAAIKDAQNIAREILSVTEKERLAAEFKGVDIGMAINARRAAANVLGKRVSGSVPLRQLEADPYRGIGRNQLVFVAYGDEEPVRKKFKVVEGDLRRAVCTLVSIVAD